MTRRRHFIALAGAVLIAGCDAGAEFGPPSTLVRSPVEATPTVGTTITGVAVTVKDADGRAIRGERVMWSADTGGTASPAESVTDAEGVATTEWTLGTGAGTQTLVADVGTLQATFTVTAVADALAELVIVHGGRVLHALGDTVHLGLVAADQFGNPVPSTSIAWTSLDGPVASVASGVVTAVSEGTARVVASSAGLADTAIVEVDQVVAGIGLTPLSPRVLVKAETLQLEAVAVDSNGAAVDTTLTVTWTSSAQAVATVTQAGLVDAVEVGEATITASAGSLTGQAALKVKLGPRPTISSIAPAVVAPGDTLTIAGSGFSTTRTLNTVTVAGAAATVLAASETELSARLDAGSLPCAPTSDVPVVVTVDELEASADHPLAAALRHDLAVGQSVTLTGGTVACNELGNPGAYVVSVFNTTANPSATSAFRLRGTGSASVAAALAGTSPALAMAGIDRQSRTAPQRAPSFGRMPEEAAHARVLEMNVDLLRRLGRPDRTRGAAALGSDAALAAVPTVGQIMALRIPDLGGSPCTDYKAVNARVAYVGTYGVVLEDTVAPLAGDIDGLWQAVGTEYDDIMHQTLLDYFGDPLVLDSQLDDNGRLLMLFSKQVNDFEGGIAGFVFSGDFYSRSQCAASDVAEIFYGIVPTSSATGYGSGTVDAWKRSMRSTVIHEVKHILSFASRIAQTPTGGTPSFEDYWLEEATARLSEEFYARTQYGYAQNGNATYAQSVYCEVRPTGWPACGEGSPYIMAKHYFALVDYYSAVERLTPIGRIDQDDYTFYGSGWLFTRWALDQSGQAEAAFVKALVGEPTLSGVQNLAARTGRSYPEMLADFSLSLALDDRDGFTPARPALVMPTWNTRDVFQGLYNDFKDHETIGHLFTSPFPLATRAISFGDFVVDVPELRGGTASLFELGGTLSGTQLMELLSASGSIAPASLGMAIVRVQ